MGLITDQVDIEKLTIEDRLELIGQLWDSLSETAPPVPEWHLDEVKRRYAAALSDPDASKPWAEVKDRLATSA